MKLACGTWRRPILVPFCSLALMVLEFPPASGLRHSLASSEEELWQPLGERIDQSRSAGSSRSSQELAQSRRADSSADHWTEGISPTSFMLEHANATAVLHEENHTLDQNLRGLRLIHAFSKGYKSDLKKLAMLVALCGICICCLIGQCTIGDQGNQPELRDLVCAHGLSGEDFPSFFQDPFGSKDFSKEMLLRAMPRLSVAFGFWLIALYSNNVAQAWLQKHMAGYYAPQTASPILWDIGFEILPAVRSTTLAELFARVPPMILFMRLLVVTGPLSMRWTILSRMLLIWGMLWGVRAVTIVATVLPNPDNNCKPVVSFPNNIFLEALANMPFAIGHSETTCQDVMFSGHTVALTLATIAFLHYTPWAPWTWCNESPSCVSRAFILKVIVIATMLVGYYVIIASKFHYTADVLMGGILSALIFHSYHSAVRVAFLSKSDTPQWGAHAFLRWFDKDAVDVVVQKIWLSRG